MQSKASIDIDEYYLKRKTWTTRLLEKIFKKKKSEDELRYMVGYITILVYLNKKGGLDLKLKPTIEICQDGFTKTPDLAHLQSST